MLQVKNETPFAATICVFNNPDGIETVYGVVKATFDIRGGRLIPAAKQMPFAPVDVHRADPTASSLVAAGELTLSKPCTDVLLTGMAHTANGPQREMDVSLKIGESEKVIRVLGDRVWKEGVLGCKPSDPEPFEVMPLIFERAFGGTDPEPRDEDKVDYEPRNPVGRGLIPKNSHAKADGIALPNLEDPAQLIQSANDRPDPACYAPIAPHWQPRQSFAGTYDEAWEKNRAPYLPEDFDSRFFSCASPDLAIAPWLQGGEAVELTGVSPAGKMGFVIPECVMDHVYDRGGDVDHQESVLDTIVIEPENNRVTLLWRSFHVVDKDLLRLKTFTARCSQFPILKAVS